MNPPIKAVTFDAAGTLFQVAEPVGTTYSRVARSHGFNISPEAIDGAFRTLWNQVPPPHDGRGIRNTEPDLDETERQWWKAFVENVFTKAQGIGRPFPLQNLEAIFEELFDCYAHPDAWQLLPGAREVLETIHHRYKIGIISNFDRRFHAIARGHSLDPYFDTVTLSSTIGASKPQSAIFAAAAASLGIDSAEILHIGDDPIRDWQGAVNAGFQVYRLDSELKPLRDVPAWIDSRP